MLRTVLQKASRASLDGPLPQEPGLALSIFRNREIGLLNSEFRMRYGDGARAGLAVKAQCPHAAARHSASLDRPGPRSPPGCDSGWHAGLRAAAYPGKRGSDAGRVAAAGQPR